MLLQQFACASQSTHQVGCGADEAISAANQRLAGHLHKQNPSRILVPASRLKRPGKPSTICTATPAAQLYAVTARQKRALATRGALLTPAEALLTWRVSVDCMMLVLLLEWHRKEMRQQASKQGVQDLAGARCLSPGSKIRCVHPKPLLGLTASVKQEVSTR